MPNTEDPLEIQQQLLEDSLPLVFEAYDDALDRKVKDPVVILLDCEDEIGGQIARGWMGNEQVDDAIALQRLQNDDAENKDTSDEQLTTVFAVAFPFKKCRHEVPPVFPYLAAAFEDGPPADGFFAISVTAGGASLLTVPYSARD